MPERRHGVTLRFRSSLLLASQLFSDIVMYNTNGPIANKLMSSQ
jgi:hypothetical protein